ncbi:MAG: hypothetical protein AB1631_02310 [Acidobacteriota bacterium]
MNIKSGSAAIIKEDFATLPISHKPDNDLLAVPLNYLQVRCAWCGLDMGLKPANGAAPYSVSHGICPDCIPKMLM